MKRFFIYACEQVYGGYHGIEDFLVEEFSDDWTLDDIYKEYVVEMSYGLMESYDIKFEDLDMDDFDTEDEYWDAYEKEREQNVDGYVAPIRKDVTLSINELNHLAVTMGPELFREKYCERKY